MRLLTSLLLLFALAAARAGAQTPDDERSIRLRRESSNEAIARHDTTGVGAILAPDVVVVTSNSVHAVGRETNLRRFAEQFRTRPDVTYRRTPDEVRVFEPWGMASERGRWTGSWTDADGKIVIGGSYFAKWRKTDGVWMVESETYVPETCAGGGYCTTVP
ncbi:MAG TPA: nuclear transport factor 2 family protein [Longimicrobiales bacterium]|nr:nuclear transport factor 2 family protein [Longimicrobiales bacterium]